MASKLESGGSVDVVSARGAPVAVAPHGGTPAVARSVWQSAAPRSTLLIRLAVGLVFFSEGIQKFLFPDALGAGRFQKIGIPAPELTAPFVGIVEVVCGLCVLVGFATRVAAAPLISVMLVAIATTKVPIGLAQGLWKMAHESRTDLAMLLGALFLLMVGAGPLSIDARVSRRGQPRGAV